MDVEFNKWFFCIYWDGHVILVFFVVDVVYHIDWFACIETSLWPWDKLNMVMVYDLFYVLLYFVCQQLIKNFCIYIHQRYWPVIFFIGGTLLGGIETHSSIHAWKIPWTEEPAGLQSMGSQRVGHDWATSLSLCLILVVRVMVAA